jgi:hypothetical protein
MRRVTRPGGTVTGAVWDYAEMTFLRRFWDAAVALDPSAEQRDEGIAPSGAYVASLAPERRAGFKESSNGASASATSLCA